jgi:GntR family transcriptional repressor for pyruvate dehydrogenase complex
MSQPSAAAREPAAFHTPKISALVAGRLRQQIIRGDLREGDSLPPEAELTAQFGISRPTLREAFRILESERLLEIRRGARGGPRVLAPEPNVAARYAGLILQYRQTSLGDVHSARLAIEPYAARLLAATADAEVKAQLDTAVAAEGEGASDEERARAGHHFHELVVTLCGNRTIHLMWQLISGIIEAHTMATVPADLSDSGASDSLLKAALRAHRKLARLVAANDEDGAEEFWRRHLEATTPQFARVRPETIVDLFNATDLQSSG